MADETKEEQSAKQASYISGLKAAWWLHLLAGIVIMVISYHLYPSIGVIRLVTFHKVVHLGVSSIHFGTQFWVSFIAGVTMVKHMPRHEFGQVQTKLFPKYFTLGIITSVMGIVSFHHLNKEGFTDEQVFQVVLMAVSLVCAVLNRFLFFPANVSTMNAMYKIEKDAGVGQQVGYKSTPELDGSDTYQKARRRFQMAHGASAIANLVSFLCSVGHIYYLGTKL